MRATLVAAILLIGTMAAHGEESLRRDPIPLTIVPKNKTWQQEHELRQRELNELQWQNPKTQFKSLDDLRGDQGWLVPKAEPPQPKPNPTWTVPPTEYDRTYNGALTITIVPSLDALHQDCRVHIPKMLGCSFKSPLGCVIIMVKDDIIRENGWTTGLLLRHEMGHCNGWPADHPGARVYKE
jgi:hypothetical protein